MPINPLDVIGNQVKSAARNQVRTAQAEFRRETSIVGYANARIGAAAKKYGDQCVVLSADVKRVDGQLRVFAKGGREDTGRDALEWIKWCVDNGAGEVCLNSIDTDGVRNGFDLEMLDAVAARVNVPIIASGGAGKKEDFLELFHHKGIDAGLAAGIFHQKLLTIRALKEYLNENGVEMRL